MVAIKDMNEKPKCCGDCPLVEKQIDMYGLKYFYCKRTGRMVDEKDVDTNCLLVEIEERKVGEWENTHNKEEWWNDIYLCSLCGRATLDNGFYCPYCGAEMRNGEDDDKSGY